jgi:hypothetical protein
MFSKLNFREIYFPHFSLTQVTGYPTYANILQLRRETIANLYSVPTTLGGGRHGHMGLGLSHASYQRGCNTPYDRVPDPGEYIPPADETNELAQQRAERRHKLAQEEFMTITYLERSCLNMIRNALEPKIVLPRNRFTGLIIGTIPEIFEYLFKWYGNINVFSLESKRQSLLAITCNHADPLNVVFNAIEEFADMKEIHGTPATDDQLMSFALMILMKAYIFGDSIEKWNSEQDKSWNHFQTFFIKAQSN